LHYGILEGCRGFLPPDAYITSAGFLLPINSAMNPLLYSPLIGQCMSRARKRITDNLLLICPRHVDDATKVDDTGEQIRQKPIPTVGDHPLELAQRVQAVPKKRGMVTANTLVWVQQPRWTVVIYYYIILYPSLHCYICFIVLRVWKCGLKNSLKLLQLLVYDDCSVCISCITTVVFLSLHKHMLQFYKKHFACMSEIWILQWCMNIVLNMYEWQVLSIDEKLSGEELEQPDAVVDTSMKYSKIGWWGSKCTKLNLHAVQVLFALLLTCNILRNCVNNVVVIGEY